MPDFAEKQPDAPQAFDPILQTENIAFSANEMQACAACGRMNPPTRLKCLYCAGELQVKAENAASIRPTLRILESWERGFNIIVNESVDEPEIGKISAYLSAKADYIRSVIEVRSPLPIARVESESEAHILITGLSKFGLACSVVGDDDLDSDKLPVRLSGIEFGVDGLSFTNFNTRNVTTVSDLALIVTGNLISSKVDSLEKKRRHGKTKLLDEMATVSDESILDIYDRGDGIGFRIHLAGFDFSCLGDDKGMIAAENLRRLVVKLKENAPQAKFVGDYVKARHSLGSIWEVEARKDPQGLQRAGLGKVEFGSITSTSNLRQFTKYSRLQWQLL